MTTLLRLETMSGAENFNARVHGFVAPYVGKRVLEVGIGVGTFTEKILPGCDEVVGVDVVDEFLDAARKRFAGEKKLTVARADMGAGIPPFLKGRVFDTIVCMNVLEHIEDDARALRGFFTLLSPGGRAVLVVPQYPWLYGALDANDGHFRRYTRPELLGKMTEAGFQIERQACFNLTGMLGWFVNGRILKRKELPQGQMKLYDRIAPFLFWAESLIGPPAGLSLLMVGRRP